MPYMTRAPQEARKFCEFKELCDRKLWRFGAKATRKMEPPSYGAGQRSDIPKGPERAIKRCPLCNKRLYLRASYCVGGEWVGWFLPDHKAREAKKPGPRRSSHIRGRGK